MYKKPINSWKRKKESFFSLNIVTWGAGHFVLTIQNIDPDLNIVFQDQQIYSKSIQCFLRKKKKIDTMSS